MTTKSTPSPLRVFAFSIILTLATLIGVLANLGISAALVALILVVVEVSFSFDNAILNAKVLHRLSPFWQRIFLTVGIVVAVVGIRILLPIFIVSLTAHLHWGTVLDLALHHPAEYAHKLELAHPKIAAFGGLFLLMLALHFFIDDNRKTLWLKRIEGPLVRISRTWVPLVIGLIVNTIIAVLPFNHEGKTTFVAGLFGLLTYSGMQLLMARLDKLQSKSSSAAVHLGVKGSLLTLLYLELLDASFSLDGVIGAFAITNDVILIAAGLGIGALWVRSLTVYMVQRQTLDNYVYLEHGAHYTVGLLAILLLTSLFTTVPEAVTGLSGMVIIGLSIWDSLRHNKRHR